MKIKFGDILIGVIIMSVAILMLLTFAPKESAEIIAVIIKDN